MSRLTIEVSSTYPGDAWREHLASKLAALHPGADIRVAYGLVDDAFVWDDEFGFCERLSAEPERVSVVEAFIDDGRDSFAAVVLAAEDLAEQVEAEVAAILRAWTRGGRGPFAIVWEWIKKKAWVRL